jgi:hypothetical protein
MDSYFYQYFWTGLTGFSGYFFVFRHFPDGNDSTQSVSGGGKQLSN